MNSQKPDITFQQFDGFPIRSGLQNQNEYKNYHLNDAIPNQNHIQNQYVIVFKTIKNCC